MSARGLRVCVALAAIAAIASTAATEARAQAAEPGEGSGLLAQTLVTADTGTGPSVVPGFGLGLVWRAPHVSVGLDGALFLASRGELADVPTVVHGSLTLAIMSARACLSEPIRDLPVIADACTGLALERVDAYFTGVGSPPAEAPTAVMIAPLVELAAEWWLSQRVAVRVSTRVLAPIASLNDWSPGPWGAAFTVEPSLGISLRLWK
jgi:hypothetical protein